MPSKPSVVSSGPTPTTGTAVAPVNGNFAGPNSLGVLNDLPPMVTSGVDQAPLVAINGVQTDKLGIQGPESPKSHG